MAEISPLVTGRSFLEGPRTRDGVLFVSDMHGDEVLRVDGPRTTTEVEV